MHQYEPAHLSPGVLHRSCDLVVGSALVVIQQLLLPLRARCRCRMVVVQLLRHQPRDWYLWHLSHQCGADGLQRLPIVLQVMLHLQQRRIPVPGGKLQMQVVDSLRVYNGIYSVLEACICWQLNIRHHRQRRSGITTHLPLGVQDVIREPALMIVPQLLWVGRGAMQQKLGKQLPHLASAAAQFCLGQSQVPLSV